MKNLVPFVIFSIALSGCSKYYPLPVSKPNLEEYHLYSEGAENHIPYPQNFSESKKYAWVYAEHYRQKKNEIYKSTYGHSDMGMFGTIAALIAGLAKSTEGVIAGGALAGGSEIAPARYQFAIQANNLGSAEKGAVCIFETLDKVSPDEQQNLAIYEEITGLQKDMSVQEYTHSAFQQIHSRLENAQAKVSLLAPDIDKLKLALKRDEDNKPPSSDDDTAAQKFIEKEINQEIQRNKGNVTFMTKVNSWKQTAKVKVAGATYTQDEVNQKNKDGDTALQNIKTKFDVCIQSVANGG